jgi:hypothetical protein
VTVKILLDPVLTAHPSRCSTFIQFATLMQRWTAARHDVFFYCLLADWDLPKEELDWLPQHPNIRYIRVPQHPDRTKEYFTLRNEIDHLISFNGELWDFDILITVRAGLAALYKLLVTSPRQLGVRYLKQVWVIENMPVMSFKGSVLVIDPDVQDRFTLDGYLAADRVTMMSYHEKAGAMRIARKFYAPTVVLELERKIKEVLPAQFSEFRLKDPAHWFEPDKDQRFCIAYVGRLAAAGTNIDKIYNVMTNQWIVHGGDRVRMVVCTVSRGGPQKTQPKDYMERFYAPREEFWRMAREEMHLLMILHVEAGFLLAMMEPILLGTPVVVLDEEWSRGQLGPSYPFYVRTELEAYTLAKLFYEDYAGMYAKFAKWHADWFAPIYTQRFAEDLLYDVLQRYLENFESTVLPRYRDEHPALEHNAVVQALVEGGPDEFVIFDRLHALSEDGKIGSLKDKLDPRDRDRRGLVWATAWSDFRASLKAFHGYEDASTTVGHMRRRKPPKVTISKRPSGHIGGRRNRSRAPSAGSGAAVADDEEG